jgi:hypothetical protein
VSVIRTPMTVLAPTRGDVDGLMRISLERCVSLVALRSYACMRIAPPSLSAVSDHTRSATAS